jgi:hypothetical protein
MTGPWPWLALIGLGAYHGINPAMGWLFAVALGLHRGSRTVVIAALLPIALGHALAVAAVVATMLLLGLVIDPVWLRRLAGLVLLGWAGWHWRFGARHRVRVGMTTGHLGLAFWSFLMATAHGAGLMLLPVLMPMTAAAGHAHAHAAPAGDALALSLAALAVHTLAMLLTTALVALLVHDWLGVAVLRRAWINLDLVWTAALVATGALLLMS